MSNKVRIERPAQIIKSNIIPISSALKGKLSVAIQTVVNKIKDKHL
jgi:hypothetical protein